jgi:CBS domain-containing protein
MATGTPGGTRGSRMALEPIPASELMTASPPSVRAQATVLEASALLTSRGLRAAPVIDQSGRPVGVVSYLDFLVHERERTLRAGAPADDPPRVADIMTPAVFSVTPETPADQVVEQMLALNVHQMFVVDRDGVLVGVVNVLDVLRKLERAG